MKNRQNETMTNRNFFSILLIGGALFWVLLQGAVSYVYANDEIEPIVSAAAEPIVYRAAIEVIVVTDLDANIQVIENQP